MALAAVIDSDAPQASRAAEEWQIPAYSSVEEFAVADPPSMRLQSASRPQPIFLLP